MGTKFSSSLPLSQVLFDIFTLKMAELDIKTVAANIIQTDFINDDIIGLILEMNEVDDEDTELSFSLEEEMDDKITFTK